MNYSPSQSQSRISSDKNRQITFQEFLPCVRLRPSICCYSSATSTIPISTPLVHRIIPDGSVNIIFNLSHPSDQYGFVTRPITEAQFVPLAKQVQLIGIRFSPGGASHFLGDHTQTLNKQSIPLSAIFGDTDTRILSERLICANSPRQRVATLEEFIIGHVKENSELDSTVNNALHIIYARKGNIKASELAGQLQISHRQLSRKFNMWVGIGPKAFCKIIRFQNILKVLPGASAKDFLSIALDSGYYDQSHFIREFHSLYGLSPSRFKVLYEEF